MRHPRRVSCLFPALLLALAPLSATADGTRQQEQAKAQASEWLQTWLATHPPGYLKDAAPDSLAISPPPPEAGTLWAELDETIARQAVALRGSARFEQA